MCGFITACIELYTTGEKQGFQTHPPKPTEAELSFRKVSPPPAKLHMLFPTHLWIREFWPQIYSL